MHEQILKNMLVIYDRKECKVEKRKETVDKVGRKQVRRTLEDLGRYYYMLCKILKALIFIGNIKKEYITTRYWTLDL